MSKLSLVLCRKGWSMHYIAMIDSSWPRGVRENPVTMHWGLKNKDQINDDENIGVSRETSLQQNEKPERTNLSISTMNENNWQWEQEEQQNLFKTKLNRTWTERSLFCFNHRTNYIKNASDLNHPSMNFSTANEHCIWCENVTLVLFEKDDILNNGFLVSRIISNLWSDEICICL